MNELQALRSAELRIEGRLPWSSNFTFLVQGEHEGEVFSAVYKPVEGERPLDDFPPRLFPREAAAYELSQALGWPHIPPTIVREDCPMGPGSLQLFVPADFEQHYLTFGDRPELAEQLLNIAAFDVVANNTDRKAGHCLLVDDKVYAIDNGLCFHVDPKLRTVIWEFAGVDIGDQRSADLLRVRDELPPSLSEMLADDEMEALRVRMTDLAKTRLLPELYWQHQIPWPPV